jgi:hypothetical protein
MATAAEPLSSQRDPEPSRQEQNAAPVNEQDGSLLGMVTASAGGSPPADRTANSLSTPVMRSPAATGLRTIAMRRAQQQYGNGFSQRVMAQVQRRTIQRQCACGGTCDACRQQQEEPALLQRDSDNAGAAPSGEPAAIPNTPGAPMDESTRGFMESRMGRDFGDVRVHTDGASAHAAQSLDANAFTSGRDVYFAEGKYQPDTHEGRHLMAHELTHVAQQSDGAAPESTVAMDRSDVAVGHPDDPLEHEADRSADRAMSGGTVESEDATGKVTPDTTKTVRRGLISGAKAVWGATGGRVVNFAEEKIEGAYEAAKEWIIDKIEHVAPGLLKLLRMGFVDYLKDLIISGLDSLFGGIISKIQKDGFLGAAAGLFGELTTTISKAASGLLSGACESFAHAAEAVTKFAKSVAGPVIEDIKKVAGAVGGVFKDILDDIVLPVWKAIKAVAGTALEWIEDKASWIWKKVEPIRNAISRAWNWIKKEFGIAWDSGSGVLDWLKDKAKAAWDKVYEFTKPIHGPLKVIGGILLILSPVGPIIAIWKGAPLLWDALTWLYNQWKKTDFIVSARNALTEHILPAIANGAQAAAGFIETAVDWLSEKIDSINEALGGLLDTLGVSSLLALARKAVQFVADSFRKFANWAKNDFFKTLNKVKEVLLKIWAFVKPILAFLLKLAIVVANPILLPIVITGYMWQILPACFKPPIVDFVLDLLIAVVRALPTWKLLGDAWPPAKIKILGALTEIRNSDVEKKIEASNRVARIMSGDDVEWLGNLLSAMIQVPDFIEGQFEEELIGMNLTEPLPFERTAPASGGDTVSQAVQAGALAPENAALLTNANLTEDQIGVTQVASFEPERELIEELQSEGGEKEFRGPADPSRTIAGVQAELNGGVPGPAASATDQTGAGETQAAPGLPNAAMSTDEQLEMMMNQPAPDTCTKEKPAQPEGGSSIPEEMKIGPLTRGQRARYLLHQIGQGIKTWFNCNASWLIPAIIGVIAVLIAVEILTGGAVTAALPAIMDIITAIMIGVAVVRVAAYTAEYVTKAISGDVAGAAKSLARGLAIAGIELIFALLFNLDTVIKSLKQGLKASVEGAAKAAKNVVKGAVEGVEKLGELGVKSVKTVGRNITGFGRAIVKNGKLLLEGVGEGLIKGVRKMEDLFKRLWNKLRFKAFRIRLSGAWFRLEGEINPWILLAEGRIEWIEKGSITEGKATKLGNLLKGKTATGEVIEGLFVGANKAKPNYRKIINLFLKDDEISIKNVIHHAIEQQVLNKFPNLYTLAELHGAENLRAIIKGAFNSEVHLSKIRVIWDDFYEVIKDAGLAGQDARNAFTKFSGYVDGYITAMTNFMRTDAAALKAEAEGNKELLRALLAEQSAKLLEKSGQAARNAVETSKSVAAAAK